MTELIKNSTKAPAPETMLEIGTQQSLLNHKKDRNQFNKWFYSTYLKKKGVTATEVVGVLAFCLGATVTLTNYDPLGIGFGKLVAEGLSAESAETVFEVFFGVAAFVPVGALIGLPTKAEAEYCLNYLLNKPQLPSRQDRRVTRAIGTATIFILSWFTGIPFYKLLRDAIDNYPIIRNILPVCLMITCYSACMHISRIFLEDYFARTALETDEIKFKRKELLQKIKISKMVIENFSEVDLQLFIEAYIAHNDDSIAGSVNDFLDQIFVALPFEHNLISDQQNMVEVIEENKLGSRLAGGFGLTCGFISCYVLYSLCLNTVNSWLDNMGETNEDIRQATLATVITIAMSTNIFFNSIFARRGAVNLFEGMTSGKWASAISVFAHIVAMFSATPSLYLAIIAAQDDKRLYALLPPTAVGTVLARSTAFEELLFKLYNRCKTQTVADTRSDLLATLDSIQANVAVLKPEVIIYLHDKFISAVPQNDAVLAITPGASLSISTSRHSIFASNDAAREADNPKIEINNVKTNTM